MLNEFRRDLVSGEWVLFATGRAKHLPLPEEDKQYISKDNCPFEDLNKSGNVPVWFYPDQKSWRIAVFKNKFPAVQQDVSVQNHTRGPFEIHEAAGTHDLVIYKDHDRRLSDFSVNEIVEVLRAYKRRYKEIMDTEKQVRYILVFHNSGKGAGASIYHPHSQIISTPILPPDVSRSVNGSYRFFEEHKKNVYDVLLQWEIESGDRIICQNDKFVALCPFVSRYPYEVRIFMKSGQPHFEQLPDDFDNELAEMLLVALKKIKKALNNPDFNMLIHTAPIEPSHVHDYYCWHIEILPKTKMIGAFEIGTGVDINVVDPDEAAKLFRETTI